MFRSHEKTVVSRAELFLTMTKSEAIVSYVEKRIMLLEWREGFGGLESLVARAQLLPDNGETM